MNRCDHATWISLVIGVYLICSTGPAFAESLDFSLASAFTYQGRLQHQGQPADGNFDIGFDLWDASVDGVFLGRVEHFDVPVRGGVFTVELDFGRDLAGELSAWLEIRVRPTGGDAYTTLHPRQRTLGGTCVVDSDVDINGNLTVDSANQITVGNAITGLNLDRDEIWVEGLATPSLLINAQGGGNLGVGRANAQAPLHVVGSPDVSPGGGGPLVIGSIDGPNVGMDNNEIMARNNGATSTLYLNNNGGDVVVGGTLNTGDVVIGGSLDTQDVVIGGTLDLELEVLHRFENNKGFVTIHCPAGKKVIGGGCESHVAVLGTAPIGGLIGWRCLFDSATANNAVYAICANVE